MRRTSISYQRAAYDYDMAEDPSLCEDAPREREEDNNEGQHDWHPEDEE